MRRAYLDNAATTPILPEVVEVMLTYLTEAYGNPQSLHHWGDEAREAIEMARSLVATLIGGRPEEIIFTGSGTEANNLVIKGLALAQQSKGKHIVVSAVEHFSVLHSVKTLEKRGFAVTSVPVDQHGMVHQDAVAESLRDDTILVSIMHANSEVGTIEPIAEIAQVVKKTGALLHSDAVATSGTIPVDVEQLGVDALSLASNQFYGPKGVGALWLKKGTRIIPLLDGGVQEDGRRAGTENVPAIAGMGKAAQLAQSDMTSRIAHLSGLSEKLIKGLLTKIDHTILTGHPEQRLPGHASFCIQFIEGEAMLMHLSSKGIAASSGSACTSKALKASHVLTAMGIPPEIAQSSLLFTLGISSDEEDVGYLLEVLPPIVDRLRDMSPIYAKFQKEQRGGR
ncbi:cysteine desulfurase family protein [Chloroflexota bacterium]